MSITFWISGTKFVTDKKSGMTSTRPKLLKELVDDIEGTYHRLTGAWNNIQGTTLTGTVLEATRYYVTPPPNL